MRSRLALALVIAVAVMIVACKRELAYERVELPGFAIDLPRSPDMTGLGNTGRTSYAAGTIKRGQARNPMHIVGLSWQPGVLSTDDELSDLMKIMATAMAGQPVTPRVVGKPRHDTIAGQPAVHLDLAIKEMKLEMVEVTCGARAIQLMVGAEEPRAIVDRITASFACHPEAAREAELAPGRAPVGFDDLTGWTRAEADEADAFTITDGTTVASFAAMTDASALDKLGAAKVIGAMIEVSLGSWTPSETLHVARHGNTRDVMFGHSTLDGVVMAVAATFWSCPSGPPAFGIAMDVGATDAAAAREAAIEVLTRARCLRPDEPPPTFAKPSDDDQ